jgi:hypothetical protein
MQQQRLQQKMLMEQDAKNQKLKTQKQSHGLEAYRRV